MVLGVALLLAVASATLLALQGVTHQSSETLSYGQEIRESQVALTRLAHDLRQASAFTAISPNAVRFQLTTNGQTLNVAYDCTAPDSLGAGYTRCARTQAVAPAAAPTPGAQAGANDIQHVTNGQINSFCNLGGTAPSGSVFSVANPGIPNTDGSGLACDEAYQTLVGPQLRVPTYIGVLARVTAGGDMGSRGLTHQTVLQAGAFLPNSDSGA